MWICGRVLTEQPEPDGRVDKSWTNPYGFAHNLPTLSGFSPTTPQAQQQVLLFLIKNGADAPMGKNTYFLRLVLKLKTLLQ